MPNLAKNDQANLIILGNELLGIIYHEICHCFAKLWAKRVGQQIWGTDSPRRFFGEEHWREPLIWNEEALIDGHRPRVFCASMADVFEKRTGLDEQGRRDFNLPLILPITNDNDL